MLVYFFGIIHISSLSLGAIHKLCRQARARGFAKCLCYYIILCSKLVYGERRRVKNLQNLVYVVCVWPLTSKRRSLPFNSYIRNLLKYYLIYLKSCIYRFLNILVKVCFCYNKFVLFRFPLEEIATRIF